MSAAALLEKDWAARPGEYEREALRLRESALIEDSQ